MWLERIDISFLARFIFVFHNKNINHRNGFLPDERRPSVLRHQWYTRFCLESLNALNKILLADRPTFYPAMGKGWARKAGKARSV